MWAKGNPATAACAAAGVTVLAAPGLVTAPLLGLAGFGSGGVVAGKYLGTDVFQRTSLHV